MRDWSFGANSLPQFKHGHIVLIEMPLWLWLIEWFSDFSCKLVPPIPFPNFPKRKWAGSDEEKYTPKEWWSNLKQLYCGTVHMRMLNWIMRHPKREEFICEVGYDKLKETLENYDPEYFKTMESWQNG